MSLGQDQGTTWELERLDEPPGDIGALALGADGTAYVGTSDAGNVNIGQGAAFGAGENA